ncbi:MAG: polysaccharide lyase family 8 super-sandwich domain-containing protein [Luteolibacter sp.]
MFSLYAISIVRVAACCVLLSSVQATPEGLDLSKAYPSQSPLPSDLDDAKRAAIVKMAASYPARMVKPHGKGVAEEDLTKAFHGIRSTFGLPNEGRRIEVDDESAKPQPAPAPAGLNADLVGAVDSLSKLYSGCTPEQAKQVETLYKELIELWLQSAPKPGDKVRWMGNGYAWRSRGPALLGMLHTLPPELHDRAAATIALTSGGEWLFREKPETSTDIALNYYPILFAAIGAMNDPALKWQYLQGARRGLDLTLLGNEPVSPDGGIIHHAGHHISYASYSFGPILSHETNLARAGFTSPYGTQALARLKLAVDAWAWTTLAGQIPPVFQLRPSPIWNNSKPPGDEPGLTIDFAKRVAELEAADRGEPDLSKITDMARIAGSKTYGHADRVPASWKDLMTPENTRPLTGHRAFPVMGAAIHRRDDWTVVVRGANASWRGAEVYAGPEWPGAYMDEIMQGALFIFSKGANGTPPNVVDSGYGTDGYDPNKVPNASSVQMDNVARAGRGNPDYMGSDAKQGGGVDLDGNGMWAWAPSHCRKSAFFFGNRITLVTRDLTMKGEVNTGLIQTRLADPTICPLIVDGIARTADGDATLSGKTAHTFLDDKGSGYFVPAGNPDLKVHRGLQQYTYAIPANLKPGLDPKTQPPLKNRKDLAAALPNYTPTQAAFSTAWFDHGKDPQGASCTFTVLVKTTAEDLEKFAATMTGKTPPFTLVTSNSLHDFRDAATGTRCVATFVDHAAFEPDGIVSINRPSTVMWTHKNQKISASLGSTDLKDSRPFVVMLEGRWQADGPLPEGASVTVDGPGTRLEIPYRNQNPVKFAMKR